MAVTDDDPFERFDRAQGAGVRDPYPGFAALLRESPVHPGNLYELLGYEPPFAVPAGSTPYAVFGFDAVSRVLRDPQTFSSSGYSQSIGLVFGRSILEMDDPDHRAYRGLIQQAFTRRAMERWQRDVVQPIVDGMIDRFVERGEADLVRELTFSFPVYTIAAMLGIPDSERDRFHRMAVEIISIMVDIDRGLRASQKAYEFFLGVIAQRRATGSSDDMVGVLAHAELDGHRLTDDEIIAFLRLLLPAGAETTYRSTSNLLFGLLSNPDQLAALVANRSLMAQAIEEGVRWEAPLTGIGRLALVDADVGGVTIPAGSPVQVVLGSANRDVSRYDRPDTFDIFREPKQSMAWAFGPHMCLGMHLARMEMTTALNALLDRLPGLRRDEERWVADDVHVDGLGFRAPRSLPVRFDV